MPEGPTGLLVLLLLLGSGILVGLLIARYASPAARENRELREERDRLRRDLEQYRSRVHGHFEQTSQLFANLTSQYRAVYDHLAHGARDLCDRPLSPPKLDLPEKELLPGRTATSPAESGGRDVEERSGKPETGRAPKPSTPAAGKPSGAGSGAPDTARTSKPETGNSGDGSRPSGTTADGPARGPHPAKPAAPTAAGNRSNDTNGSNGTNDGNGGERKPSTTRAEPVQRPPD